MNTIRLAVVIAALTAFFTTLALVPRIVHGFDTSEVLRETVYLPQPTLSASQVIWLSRLMQCESGIKDSAINPNDLDNTPSYGILQFKPSTFALFASVYGISGNLMDAQAQVAIVTQMILKGGIEWDHQFPACTARLGLPPKN